VDKYKSALQKIYKPDSVPPGRCVLDGGDHFSGIRVTSNLKRPTRRPRPGQPFRKIANDRTGVFLFGLASGDAYRAGDVTTTAVGSYSTVSPLPDP